ncbi:MAG TPA: PqqD family protein [Solirubrobacterales bacterium]|nr:PqqD family protein [Solirubrobacterales bacterium]
MADEIVQTEEPLLEAKVKVPQSVVFRSFPTETVVLNLQTGKYHGLNPTAGKMLQALTEADSVRAAAAAVATEYDAPAETIEVDICDLCQNLLDRGLVERDGSGDAAGEGGD